MLCKLGRLALGLILLALATPAFAVTSASNGVFSDTNQGYIKQPSATGIPGLVYVNGQLQAGLGTFYPHSTIVTYNGQAENGFIFSGQITDTQFYNLLANNLINNGNWTQDSLVIHMAQCFSGGFIDELDNGNVQNVEINTASWWGSPSYGAAFAPGTFPMAQNNTYSNAWYQALLFSPSPAGSVNHFNESLVGAYAIAVPNDQYHNQELPQYYASSNAMNNDVIGVSAQTGQPINANEKALVFVGNDQDYNPTTNTFTTATRHWNDAVKYIGYLLAQGYQADNIYFYYANNIMPEGAQPLPNGISITGAGTSENFNSFFNNVAKGSTGQVNVWTSDHGGLQYTFNGKAAFSIKSNGKGSITTDFQIGNNVLQSYISNPGGDGEVEIDGGGITGLTSGDMLDLVLTDPQGRSFDLGNITSDGNDSDSFDVDVPYSDILAIDQDDLAANDPNGDVEVELADYNILADSAAYAGDYSNVDVDDFSFDLDATQVIPEPASIAVLVLLTPLVLRRNRRI